MRATPILIDGIYQLADFQELTARGDSAIRSARRNGLRVMRCGQRGYVHGRDFLDFLRTLDAGSDGAVTDPQPSAARKPSLAELF